MNTKIDFVPDEKLFLSGITKYIKWDYTRLPHMVIFGSTGSGKTYLLKILLGRIAKYIPDSELCICDYKSDEDFSFAAGSHNLYRFSGCIDGLNRAIDLLQERQQGNSDRISLPSYSMNGRVLSQIWIRNPLTLQSRNLPRC